MVELSVQRTQLFTGISVITGVSEASTNSLFRALPIGSD